MIRIVLMVTATFALSAPLSAQEAVEPSRYERALAAGYKALFLCSAIANAERNGTTRAPESVLEWELRGIQAPLDKIVRELPHRIVRFELEADGWDAKQVDRVEVDWADDMGPRIAVHNSQRGCQILPIGADAPTDREIRPPQGFMTAEQIATASMRPLSIAGLTNGMTFELKPDGDADEKILFESPFSSVFDKALNGGYGTGTRTTAVSVSNSEFAHEMYRAGFDENTPQRTWSVAKSIAATVVGVAVHRDGIDVTAPAAVLEWQNDGDPRQEITLDNLLRMASGLTSDTLGNRTDPIYFGGATVTERAVNWPLLHYPAGSRRLDHSVDDEGNFNSYNPPINAHWDTYRYANNDTLLAIHSISTTFESHPPSDLFAKLWMQQTVAETDWQGNYILSSQVWSTANDLAKLGQLYLNDGVLPSGERIVPEGWVEYVSSPSGPQPEGRPFGYGAGFWLMNNSEGVPDDTFAAFGNRGQYVVIVPSSNVVIVRRGEDPVGSRFDIAAFTKDVLAALEE